LARGIAMRMLGTQARGKVHIRVLRGGTNATHILLELAVPSKLGGIWNLRNVPYVFHVILPLLGPPLVASLDAVH